tara:strand:- start:2397 stop:4196 length:1800 start_codon:yes stop_codon:yes gene_type:complete
MNENKRALYLILFIVVLGALLIQTKNTGISSEITNNEIMGHIRYLSHDSRGGRYPGTRGSKDAIAYLVKRLKSYGVGPGVENSYVQPFDITTGITLDNTNYAIINEDSLVLKRDYIPLSFSSSGITEGGVVFAGYGFDINEDQLQWNDYSGINVKDKWVMVMRHSPERGNNHSPFAAHSPLHKKMLIARDKGAVGIIFISQLEDEDLLPLNYMPGYDNSEIPALHLSNNTADKLLANQGWSRQKIQETMNRSLESLNFQIDGKTLKTSIGLKHTVSRGANVIGEIKSGNRKYRDEYVVIGAHFDHVGQGGPGSGSRKPDLNVVHPGADDNASGTSGLLEIAQKLAAQKSRLKRSVVLIGFDAEEKGLLGAKYFVENPTIDLDNIVTMINMDMIGRMEDSSATVGGVGTSPAFESLLDSLKVGRSFDLSMSEQGFGPSDHAAFYSKNIPVLFFFSGFHNEYHTPEDTWKHINLQGTTDIVNLVYDVVYHLSRTSSRPRFTEAGPKQAQAAPMNRSFKVTFGIMPSYTSSEEGLQVDGISKPDGPAATAGITKGDVIKSIDGKIIKNIYEYMDRLGELKTGATVPVTIERNGKQLVLNVSF